MAFTTQHYRMHPFWEPLCIVTVGDGDKILSEYWRQFYVGSYTYWVHGVSVVYEGDYCKTGV